MLHYLSPMKCKHNPCHFEHTYEFTAAEIEILRKKSLSMPCTAIQRGAPFPIETAETVLIQEIYATFVTGLKCTWGDKCIYGHKCPSLDKCTQRKCKFKGREFRFSARGRSGANRCNLCLSDNAPAGCHTALRSLKRMIETSEARHLRRAWWGVTVHLRSLAHDITWYFSHTVQGEASILHGMPCTVYTRNDQCQVFATSPCLERRLGHAERAQHLIGNKRRTFLIALNTRQNIERTTAECHYIAGAPLPIPQSHRDREFG